VRSRAETQWGGRTRLRENALDWGDYRFSAHDGTDGTLLFRAGFDSNLDPDAASAATNLSVRLPLPSRAFRAAVEKRRTASAFQSVWDAVIDPAAGAVDRSPLALKPRVDTVFSYGTPDSKVDIAILGDGYITSEYPKFAEDARRAMNYLFSVQPFAGRMRDFNVRTVFVPSAESGATDAYLGVRRNTVFRCAYGSGKAERTLAVHDHHALCEAASAVPYDFVLVLINARRYGGSAYFGGPAVVAIDSATAKYLVVHEFAHVIGGLADEYYIPEPGGPVYSGNIEPWNPNVTLAREGAKWARLATDARLVPQPWNKTEYERYFGAYVARYMKLRAAHASEEAVEKFMRTEADKQAALLAKNGDAHAAGLFEGANGYAKGVFRSGVNCIMFSLQSEYFCPACTFAIERMIDEHVR
jgi:hypothetical protein